MDFGKDLDSLAESDLQGLVRASVSEIRTLDYKRDLPGPRDADKRKLAADVSSFANAAGGHIIYGIEAKKGIATAVVGVLEPSDPVILRLESISNALIKPRIPGLRMAAIPLRSGKHCLVVQIPVSWISPHAVSINDAFRFYSRNLAGKYLLNIAELRTSFGLSNSASAEIRNFRADRIMKIAAGELPTVLEEGPRAILHLIPIRAFAPGTFVEVREFEWKSRQGQLTTLTGGFHAWRYNFDGILATLGDARAAPSYVQVFRNGIIEAVDTYIVGASRDKKQIPSVVFEKKIIEALPTLLAAEEFMGADLPILVMLSLAGVEGYTMANQSGTTEAIDRDVLLVSEVVAEDFRANPSRLLKPVMDVIWNACGITQSPNFDIDGNYLR